MSAEPAAGWYSDSDDPNLLRYWDGLAWTAMTQPLAEDATVEGWFPMAASSAAGGGASRAVLAELTRRGAHRAPRALWFARKRVVAPVMLAGLVAVGGVLIAVVNGSGDQRGEALLASDPSTSAPHETEAPVPTETPSTSDSATSESSPSAAPLPVAPPAARAPRPALPKAVAPSPRPPRSTTPPPAPKTPTAPARTPKPKTTPRPSPSTPRPTPTPTPTWQWDWDDWDWGGNGRVFYRNCDEVRAAGNAPLLRGQPGYRRKLDPNRDGIACT